MTSVVVPEQTGNSGARVGSGVNPLTEVGFGADSWAGKGSGVDLWAGVGSERLSWVGEHCAAQTHKMATAITGSAADCLKTTGLEGAVATGLECAETTAPHLFRCQLLAMTSVVGPGITLTALDAMFMTTGNTDAASMTAQEWRP